MITLVEERRVEVAEICRRYSVRRLDLFGSATATGFDPEASDLDFVVSFQRDEGLTCPLLTYPATSVMVRAGCSTARRQSIANLRKLTAFVPTAARHATAWSAPTTITYALAPALCTMGLGTSARSTSKSSAPMRTQTTLTRLCIISGDSGAEGPVLGLMCFYSGSQ